MYLKQLSIGFALALTACGETPAPPAPPPERDVEQKAIDLLANAGGDDAQLYQEYCATCHEGGVHKAPHVVTFQMMPARAILDSMEGVMKQQASDLSEEQKRSLAEFLSGQKLGAVDDTTPVQWCDPLDDWFDTKAPRAFTGWGLAPGHTRFVDAETAALTADDVPLLTLKWAFAYPNATRARSQPAVAGGAVFVGSQDGTVYALDEETGCARWTFTADAEVRSAITVSDWSDGSTPALYFGDFKGNVYKLDATNGAQTWQVGLEDHPNVTITGSPTLHDGRLYVPMSSTEWASAADPGYECCTFRGGVTAFDAATGRMIWKTHSITEQPRLTGETNSEGTPQFQPAGAPVWNSPTIDEKRRRLYVGTGEAYTSPAADTSDAILAMDLETGDLLWHWQATQGDAWNMACTLEDRANCPEEDGPDFDFGASPILLPLDEERDIILAGQKSGFVHGIDPETGAHLWSTRTGLGGFAGGVHWGMAAHDGVVYAPNADTDFYGKWEGERKPGLNALDAATGDILWYTPAPNQCPEERKPACDPGLSAAVTAMPGVVFAGGFDGILRAYNSTDGSVIWEFDTVRKYVTVNGETAQGGTIESDGPVIANGKLLVNSGYLYGGREAGNVLLVFSVNGQ
ncbi:MAG: PQQ-binding-like beta-propeller repeat protein [Alphaproteobacteria bacterium]